MPKKSKIEWTEMTWNPVTGCTKVSPGCKHCYAATMAKRLRAMGSPRYIDGFRLTLHEDLLEVPLRWHKPRRVFVNSMSDLFHKDVPDAFIEKVFDVMRRCPRHDFQVLTKRPERVAAMADQLPWPENVWMGVSVESAAYVGRVRLLQSVPTAVRFLSVEPLLGPIPDLPLEGIDWVIVGGESGPGARPMVAEWVTDLRDQCESAEVAFFFKQWGGVQKHRTGRLLEGQVHDAMPPARPLGLPVLCV